MTYPKRIIKQFTLPSSYLHSAYMDYWKEGWTQL